MSNQRFSPESERQTAELVRWAVAEGKTLDVQGKNTKRGFGLPVAADCVLCMNRLAGITGYHPEELVMVALPGTPLAEVRRELAKHNQHLAFEPPAVNRMYQVDEEGTIGGTFMGNLAGPRRFSAGSARDHILGIRAVNGRGQIWKSGGKVIKNVSGYDLSKLLAGSWGTLSVVTELAFKVLPAPPVSRSLAVWDLSPRLGLALLAQVVSTPCEASGLAYLPAAALANTRSDAIAVKGESLALVRLEGTALSVGERLQSIDKWLPAACRYNVLEQPESELAWSWVRDAVPLLDRQRTPTILKISLPPACAWKLTRFIDELRGCLWYLDAAGGWLWAGICQASAEDKLHALRREVGAAGGSATLYRAPLPVKRNAGIYSFLDEAVRRLNEKVKHSFDPVNVFNPGRLYLPVAAQTGSPGRSATGSAR